MRILRGNLDTFNYDTFSFDVETRDKDTGELTADWYQLEVFMVSMHDGEQTIVAEVDNDEDIAKLFSGVTKDSTVVAHNIVFDMGAIKKHGVNLHNANWFCTLIAYHLLDETDKRAGLKKLAEKYLDADTEDIEHAYQDSDRFEEYAANDAIWTYELAQIFVEKLREEKLMTLFKKIEMPFQRVLVEMRENGILIDKEKALKYRKALSDELVNMECQMLDLLGVEYQMQFSLTEDSMSVASSFNINSSHQLREVLYEDWGLPIVEETDSGAPSTSSSAIKKLIGKTSGDKKKFLELIREYSKGAKLYSSFFKPIIEYIDGDGRVRCSLLGHTTVTGRLSSRNPNNQQLPRNGFRGINLRECYSTAEGRKMVAIDFSGQENRVAAQVVQDENFIEAIRKNKDLHLVNANSVFNLGLSGEQLINGTEAHAKAKKKHKKKRQKAKIFSYGILYGGTAYTLQKAFNCTEKEAKEYLENYFKKFPGMKQKREDVKQTVDEQGFVRSMYGRKRRLKKKEGRYGTYYSGRDYRQAFNHLIQGACADMMRVACIKLMNYKIRNPEYGIKMLLTVHDEVVISCKEEHADKVAEDGKKLFASVVNEGFAVEMPAEADIGDNYNEAK
jgi:DNA polymerase-1